MLLFVWYNEAVINANKFCMQKKCSYETLLLLSTRAIHTQVNFERSLRQKRWICTAIY